jgi:putative acetyltransferase
MLNITIRRAAPDDAEDIQRIFDTPRAVWGTLQVPYMSAEFRRRRLAEADDSIHPLAAVVDGEVVGQLTLHTFPRPRRKHAGALGMAVRDDWQGRGVGTALMAACIDLADNWLNLHRLELEVFVDNEAAIRLYKKFGFVIEGRLVDYAYREGQYVDTYVMGRIRDNRPRMKTDETDEYG